MINVAFFSAKNYDELSFNRFIDPQQLTFHFHDFRLTQKTAQMAKDCQVVCAFVNDELDAEVLQTLYQGGTRLIAMRCAGFDKVDLAAAKQLGLQVVRVPAYSPEAVAEHTVGLMMCLNRRFHKAYQRTREANFSLEGLVGFNFYGKTVGVIGTGKIGVATMRILKGLGMTVLCYDPYQNPAALELGAKYVELPELYANSDVITLHCPMSKENYHLLNEQAFNQMKDKVMIINTSRGELLDSAAAIEALKRGRIGSLGLDVYDNEKDLFFQDKSNDVIVDDVFRRLSSCHNVLFTGHQAFLTEDALNNIAQTTLNNILVFSQGKLSGNELIND
ncbi:MULTISPECIES: 2-hydroxyacid dehydrogenase [unclassified Vibrio]|uniref:2-hydroxyacid dehydrogenase n=2 Tax=Unclassified Bacteria TaxID=49928 RepID=A0AAU6V058_UNCXX|nr:MULTISPECIES: 2-hydroxyacid dehydrogenase [unclassified Vibrio]EKO3640701.1 2-hydroxyacid dehydrogenase [Vibrio metschnikovii]EKO3722234.1 2-hydroxyacid dehydrogenase [Vibrio metschnikovii]EKO3725889.1 2-hydroxyacid dehydrogenase [Vibrio metschnikovii]EKO3938205.1 2-hydroxyacid dehydrogenase [Vibrio metschnikovii]MDQ2108435.1 2-hydroxyacid dehydrogenase [Vibrio sp. 2017_1457_15]